MQTLLDVWEGSLDIDEPTLIEGGVVGLIIRLNSIAGGHHKDENFDNQWAQAKQFLRAPYFVYNPWKNGPENFEWLMANLPTTGVSRVFPDVEVTKTGYSAEVYADEYQKFYDLLTAETRVATYTGEWFLSTITHWPGGDYWWGRYPYKLCPQGAKEYWTWSKWQQESAVYGYHPDPTKHCPGNPILWQASGDKLILPGTANRTIDLNLWNGTLAELEHWWGAPKPPTRTLEERIAILEREARANGWNLTL